MAAASSGPVEVPESEEQEGNAGEQRRPCVNVGDVKKAIENTDFRSKKQNKIRTRKNEQNVEQTDLHPGFTIAIAGLFVSFPHIYLKKKISTG
jgi:hypothetical protein